MTPPELERLASGVLCVGFTGKTLADVPVDALRRLAPAGLILFSRNVGSEAETRALTDGLRDAIAADGETRPFAAVDQEGGRVQRLGARTQPIPPMMAVGAAADVPLAERVGGLIGDSVRSAGIDVAFAPVMDLALKRDGTTIGDRAFGDDPARTGELGAAVVRGIQWHGVAATLKHFPGHGSTAADSHTALPMVDVPRDVLGARDIVPFAGGIAAGARAVMSAHVVFSAYDAERPATLSPRILHDLLRDELRFRGVCFTDCLEMDAIARTVGTAEAAVQAIAAGADCCVISHTLETAIAAREALARAAAHDDTFAARLDEAAARVRALALDVRKSGGSAQTRADTHAAKEVARRAITLVRSGRGVPLQLHGPVTVVAFEDGTRGGAEDAERHEASLAVALRRRRMHAELMRVPLEPSNMMIAQLRDVVHAQRRGDVVILCRRAHVWPQQRRAVEALFGIAPDAILVSMREPFDVALFPQAHTVLCSFGDQEIAVDALADVLIGKALPVGQMPVHVAPQ